MAANTNKRVPVKWIRDKAKAAYEKDSSCYVCGSPTELELHHLHSVHVLLEMWAKTNNYDLSSDEAIIALRDQFIAEHRVQLYELVYTLCNAHHKMLHGVYGKSPPESSVEKQKVWLEIQKSKCNGTYVRPPSLFDKFLVRPA